MKETHSAITGGFGTTEKQDLDKFSINPLATPQRAFIVCMAHEAQVGMDRKVVFSVKFEAVCGQALAAQQVNAIGFMGQCPTWQSNCK